MITLSDRGRKTGTKKPTPHRAQNSPDTNIQGIRALTCDTVDRPTVARPTLAGVRQRSRGWSSGWRSGSSGVGREELESGEEELELHEWQCPRGKLRCWPRGARQLEEEESGMYERQQPRGEPALAEKSSLGS